MIELTKYEVQVVSGGDYYYTLLGMVIGPVFTAGRIISSVGKAGFSEENKEFTTNFIIVCSTIAATFGLVVGAAIDNSWGA